MMIDTKKFVELLETKLGVNGFIGVPCSNLKYIINETTNEGKYIEAPNEGEAVAYSAGAYMAGKKIAVMMQNSGLANAMNVITSLSCIYQVPHLFLIGYRGMHGTGTDEPQHEVMGRVTEKWLKDCGFQVFKVCDWSNEDALINEGVVPAYETDPSKPIAILFDKKECTKVEPSLPICRNSKLSRSDVIDVVCAHRDDKTIVIATTGFTGRDLYDHHKNNKNFYMVGSMGCAISLACGIAKNKPDYKVIVLDGDGAVMMRPQGGILYHNLDLPNVLHIILDNYEYESTGGQQVPGTRYDLYRLESGIHNRDDKVFKVYDNKEVLNTLISSFIEVGSPYRVAIVDIDTRKNNNDLGRPKETSVELCKQFMEAINETTNVSSDNS